MLKQEVIIIACAFQQIIHIVSNNNEQRNVYELGVTVKSLDLLAGARQPSCKNGAIFPDAVYTVSNSTRACTNQCTFAIGLSRDSAWLSKQFKNWSSCPRAPKQPTEVSTLIQT